MTRFKIDLNTYGGSGHPFALYREEVDTGLFGGKTRRWCFTESFATRDEARKFYEKIKDLPEYLGGAK